MGDDPHSLRLSRSKASLVRRWTASFADRLANTKLTLRKLLARTLRSFKISYKYTIAGFKYTIAGRLQLVSKPVDRRRLVSETSRPPVTVLRNQSWPAGLETSLRLVWKPVWQTGSLEGTLPLGCDEVAWDDASLEWISSKLLGILMAEERKFREPTGFHCFGETLHKQSWLRESFYLLVWAKDVVEVAEHNPMKVALS
nr:hypothetical protein Iba_chr12dCG10990 [Ipomoea batatas]